MSASEIFSLACKVNNLIFEAKNQSLKVIACQYIFQGV